MRRVNSLIGYIVLAGLLLAYFSWPAAEKNEPARVAMPALAPRAPAVRILTDREIRLEAMAKVKVRGLQWFKQYNVMTINVTFDNRNDFDVKDIVVRCDHAAPSGTMIDSNTRTIYEVVRARESRSIRDFSMGFIHSQVARSGCRVTDLAIGKGRPPRTSAPLPAAAPLPAPRPR